MQVNPRFENDQQVNFIKLNYFSIIKNDYESIEEVNFGKIKNKR